MPADFYSSILGWLNQGTGNNNNSWGENCDTAIFPIFEQAIAGSAVISTTGGTTNLATSPPPAGPSAARYAILDVAGTLVSDAIIQVPNLTKSWIVYNGTSGAFSLSLKTPSGPEVAVPQGTWTIMWCDGANSILSLVGTAAAAEFLQAPSNIAARQAIGIDDIGEIADFARPIPPAGWIECTGAAISRTAFADLFNAITIQQTGTRSSTGNGIISGLSSTTYMKAGMPVSGTGIPSSTTIASVDSGSQITLSNNNSSTGTSTVTVAPWGVGDGSTTFNLPPLSDTGRFRRSRSSSTRVGQIQSSQNLAHTHALTGTTDSQGSHTHTITDPGHSHSFTHNNANVGDPGSTSRPLSFNTSGGTNTVTTTTTTTGISINSGGAHTHSLTGNTGADGGTEARPEAAVVMTCIKYA